MRTATWVLCIVAMQLLAIRVSPAAESVNQYPSRPLTLLAGSPPGASNDVYSRIISQPLGKLLGQAVIVESRTGASGLVATNSMLASRADGYTMQMIYTAHTLAPYLYDNVKFDMIKDVSGVSLLITSPLVLVVNTSSPVKTINGLIQQSKPRSLSYASAGIGSGGHLAAEMLRRKTGMQVVHVPYRGAAQAASAVAAGDVSFSFVSQVTARELMMAGKLRAIAVTGTKRTPMLPNVPTVEEQGVHDFEFFNWFGIAMSAKTPRPIVAKLNRAIVAVLKQPEVVRALTSDGSEIVGDAPAEFDRFLAADNAKWGKLLTKIGIDKNGR
jgi:tripartite-type tricarboxylate transporter receptor subunit TctC